MEVNEVGRGLLMYIREGQDYDFSETELTTQVMENQTITMTTNENKKIVICSVYRSPSSDDANNNKINQLLRETVNMNVDHVIFVGDFNYPNINWNLLTNIGNDQDKEYYFIETIKDCFLVQHVDRPTRARGTNQPSLLDLVLTDGSCPEPNVDYSSPLGKSDHCMLQLSFDFHTEIDTDVKVRLQYDRGDYNRLRRELNIDWQRALENAEDINEVWTRIRDKILEAEGHCVPQISLTSRLRRHVTPLDRNIRKKIKRKKRLWSQFVHSRNQTIHREYCQLRNNIRKLTRQKKKQYEKDIALQASSNPKKFWSYANRKMSTRENIPKLSISGDPKKKDFTRNEAETANVFGEIFSSVFTQEPDGHWNRVSIIPDMEDHLDTSPENVLKILADINPSKSPGPDRISPRILKEAKEVLSYPLSYLFTKSLSTGKLPEEWKHANITPIHKKGDRRIALNYRPVSLTSVVCKVMEKVIRQGILRHMITHQLLSTRQHGFISGRSTLLQLLLVLEKWTEALDRGEDIDVVFLDFQKAFDKVPHRRMMDTLRYYGVRGDTGAWIRDFLSGRRQRVMVKGSSSSWRDVLSGIPQGSVLGPILFVLYINSLPDVVSGSEVYLFADDVKIFKSIVCVQDQITLQNDIDSMYEWTKDSLLVFNPQKCSSMTISKRKPENRCYEINSCRLRVTESERDLGVVVDNKLTFEEHIWSKIKKANTIMGIIRRTYTYLDDKTFLLLYKALVRPHIEYANQIWCPFLKKHIDGIENVQRRATRLLPNMSGLTYQERLQRLNIPTLSYRRVRGDLIEVFKLVTGKYDNDVAEGLLEINPRVSRGNKLKLIKKRATLNVRKYFFTNRVVNIWNKLPNWVVEAESTKGFEKNIDKYMANHPIRFDHRAHVEWHP